jgi:hypothetical protein
MIEQVCAHIHNYFETDPVTGRRLIYPGTYTITDGVIVLPFLEEDQYYRIFGSRKNDGVHQYKTSYGEGEESELKDETFDGVIWEMRPPQEFLKLVSEISDWMDKYGDTMRNPYQSEDVIGAYRYTKMTSGKVTGDYIATWQNVYKDQLKEWRCLS